MVRFLIKDECKRKIWKTGSFILHVELHGKNVTTIATDFPG